MDLAAIERSLRATEAGTLLADARLVRRVIKRHRRLPGLGLSVPHARCYVLRREALLDIVGADELGPAGKGLPDDVILLPRPEPDEAADGAAADVLERLWRSAFHARVHLEIEGRLAEGKLTDAMIRGRIHRLGQTEFDEIRLVLRGDELLLPPYGDRETYAEFAALYLELRHFAPALLRETFPTLGELDRVDAALAEDVDAARLLAACCPEGTGPAPRTSAVTSEPPPAPAPEPDEAAVSPIAAAEVAALLAAADVARGHGNVMRSALLRLRAAPAAGARSAALGDEARADLEALATRLSRALGRPGEPDEAPDPGWAPALLALAEQAARGGLFRRVEARLLYDLEKACLAGEKAIGKVDLVEWALSLARRPLARLLPATREIRIARCVRAASKKLPLLRLPEAHRERVAELVGQARRRADENIREALRPAVADVLGAVGLRPENVPERVALAKVVEELLDHATAHGFLGIGLLRDALSKNQLKLPDLSGPRELALGDALLLADRRLAGGLDGVHRRGEIYLRALQKLSSLLFGTRPGRLLTEYLLLPFGSAFVVLKGTELMVAEIGHLTHLIPHHHHLHLLNKWSFAVTSILLLVLLHSAAARAGALAAVRAVGSVLRAIFVRAPAWFFSRPIVKRFLESRGVLALRRFVLKPAAIAAVALLAPPLRAAAMEVRLPVVAAIFAVVGIAINSRTGAYVEEVAVDALVRSFRRLRRHVLPGLFRLVVDSFRWLTDALDRGIYTVDEWLRFREGQGRGALAGKAIVGVVWFAIAYLLRVYVNLFLEPTFNPVKHFPVVTVAAKLLLAVTKSLAEVVYGAVVGVLGAVVAGALAGLAVASLPGVFGFLVWEFKENYKLYRATRAATLRPVPFGHHGETMATLMKPGFHSGTLPKLWAKRRRSARKGEHAAAEKHEEALREIEEAVERFVDRELVTLLHESERWQGGPIHVARVELASNRVKVELAEGSHGAHAKGDPCVIAFEEQSGWIVAGVSKAGFAGGLSAGDRVIFENALGGLYQLAAVDLVREQIAAALPGAPPYDISDEGLVVWPGDGYEAELVYKLEAGAKLTAKVRGDAPKEAPPVIERASILFREQPITWAAWVEAWGDRTPARVVKGASLLP